MRHVSALRVATSKTLELWKTIKLPVKTVYELMRKDEEDYVSLFVYCYPNLWKTIQEFHIEMATWNSTRVNRHLKPVYIHHSASEFLLFKLEEYRSKAKFVKGGYGNDSSRQKKIDELRKDSLNKLNKSNIKESVRERLTQHVPPSYAQGHISVYYDWRKSHADDIDTRYLIIHELSKYKCEESIRFLTGLVRCEKNLSLQHYAWQCLNRLGVTGVHKGRRPGRKKVSWLKPYKEINSPQELLHAIYNSPLERMKHYDLFLSHSYKDSNKLIQIKDELNALGLTVYVDWVNDKDELLRSKTCAETAGVITERMKRCKAVLYIHTESSLSSKWTPWELGYAYAKGFPILVYRPETDVEEPEYLQLYQSVIKVEDTYRIEEAGVQTPLLEWLSKQRDN